jgi:hypothetical protein
MHFSEITTINLLANGTSGRLHRLGLSEYSSARMVAGLAIFAHVGRFPPEQEFGTRRGEEIDHLGIFAKPGVMLCTSPNDHDVALAADPLFAAEAELHLPLQHSDDLLIGVTVRPDMDTGPDTPPYDHALAAGEDAAADLFAELLLE